MGVEGINGDGWRLNIFKNCDKYVLAGVVQWIEHRPVNLKAAGLTLNLGIYLGCGPRL